MVLCDGDHGFLSVKLRDCQFFSGTQFVPTGLHWYPLWLFTWSFGYSSTTSDGSPYEKRVDAKGRVLSDERITGEVPFEIPKPWVWARMESILEFINGRAYKKSELLTSGKYPVLRVGNLFTNSTWYYSNLELDSNKYCHNGDLLYAWSASFGPTIWSGPDCIFHYHIWNVKHSEFIDLFALGASSGCATRKTSDHW